MRLDSNHESTVAGTLAARGMAPPDTRFELRHLRYFTAVAEHLHFGRAAKALNISQPPLSRQIQDLEYHLGTQLLQRSARSVTLTPEGKVFFAESKRILSQVCQSIETVRRAARGEAGSLNVGLCEFFDSGLVSPIQAALTEKIPHAQFFLQVMGTEEQLCSIRTGRLDAGIVLLPIYSADQIRIEPLFRIPAIALVANTNPLANRREVSLQDLATGVFVDLRDLTQGPYSHVEDMSRMCGVPICVTNHLTDLERLFQEVRESDCIAILPSCVRQVSGPGIACVPIMERDADFTFGVARQCDREDSLLQVFVQKLYEVNLCQVLWSY